MFQQELEGNHLTKYLAEMVSSTLRIRSADEPGIKLWLFLKVSIS